MEANVKRVMATTLLESVMHYKKKLDKNPEDEVILNVIHKLSKLPITVEVLEATHIGKNIRNLSRRDDAVGNKAKIVLKKWRNLFSNLVTEKLSNSDGNLQEKKHKYKNSSHSGSGVSEKYKKKHVDATSHVKENNASKKDRSLSSSEVKQGSRSKYKQYDPHAEVGENYDFVCPQLISSGSETVMKEKAVSETYEPSQKRKHSKVSDENGAEAGIKLPSKKLKFANDSDSLKYTEKKDKQHSLNEKCESQARSSHSVSVSGKKETPPSVKSDKGRGSKPKSLPDSKKITGKGSADGSSGKSDKLKQTKKVPVYSSEEFTSSNVTFEACLGLNDVVDFKKKKSFSSKPHKTLQSSTTKKSSVKDTKRRSEKDISPIPKTKTIKESSHEEKAIFEPLASTKTKSEPGVASTASTLPEVQPNYRPLPRNLDAYSKKKVLTNEDAIMFISSRKEKTAVYSGKKSCYLTEVPSLVNCCTRFLIENIDALEYVGDLPYYLLQPVLEKCSPTQLMNIENFNPHLMDKTNELWKVHCKKDYKLLAPLEHETWRDLYLRGSDERERKLKSVTANISANISKSNPARQLKLAYVDSVAKPPRDVARRQAKHGTAVPASTPVKTVIKIEPPSKPIPKPSASAVNAVPTSSSSTSVERPSFPPKKPKVAPLMAKTLKSMKQCFRR